MIIDSSALIAILRFEADANELLRKISSFSSVQLSAANYVESAAVIDSFRDAVISRRLDEFIEETPIHIAPVTERQARLARQAYRDFGKGSGHRAKLNFGDCFAYALAIDTGEPLLFKGDDFTHTGVAAA